MKLEIDIHEAEIKSAIERNVRAVIANQTEHWRANDEIKAKIKEAWTKAVDDLIAEIIGDSDKIRQKVESAIEAKLKAQITKPMKETK
jgi:uncharacterized protein YjbJ (UPF0337 family)